METSVHYGKEKKQGPVPFTEQELGVFVSRTRERYDFFCQLEEMFAKYFEDNNPKTTAMQAAEIMDFIDLNRPERNTHPTQQSVIESAKADPLI